MTSSKKTPEFSSRVVIENVQPEVDGGRFPVKRVVGAEVSVTADVLAEGHDLLAGRLLHHAAGEVRWTETPLTELGNDRFLGRFRVTELGRREFTIEAWVDRFATWRRDLMMKTGAHNHQEGRTCSNG